MIASENFAPLAVMQARDSELHREQRRGLTGPPLLRRLRARRRHRAARDRPGDRAVRRHRGQRPAARRCAGQRCRDGRAAHPQRHHPEPGPHGGHLTHRMRLNFSGRLNDVAADGVRPEDARVDMNQVRRLVHERQPRMIIAGWSAYPRQLGSAQFRQIADAVGAPCHGRHGAFRRAGHGGSAPQPGATRPRVTAGGGSVRGPSAPDAGRRPHPGRTVARPGHLGAADRHPGADRPRFGRADLAEGAKLTAAAPRLELDLQSDGPERLGTGAGRPLRARGLATASPLLTHSFLTVPQQPATLTVAP